MELASGGRTSRGDWRAQIRYRYKVGGKEFTAFGIGDHDWGTEVFVQALARRYPAGKPVQVFYNPNNPYDAVLERGLWKVSGESIVCIVLGVITFVTGAGLYWSAYHSHATVEHFMDYQERWRKRRIARRLAKANPSA